MQGSASQLLLIDSSDDVLGSVAASTWSVRLGTSHYSDEIASFTHGHTSHRVAAGYVPVHETSDMCRCTFNELPMHRVFACYCACETWAKTQACSTAACASSQTMQQESIEHHVPQATQFKHANVMSNAFKQTILHT